MPKINPFVENNDVSLIEQQSNQPIATKRDKELSDYGKNIVDTLQALSGDKNALENMQLRNQDTAGSYQLGDLAIDTLSYFGGVRSAELVTSPLLKVAKDIAEKELTKKALKATKVVTDELAGTIAQSVTSGVMLDENGNIDTKGILENSLLNLGIDNALRLSNIQAKKTNQTIETQNKKLNEIENKQSVYKEQNKKQNTSKQQKNMIFFENQEPKYNEFIIPNAVGSIDDLFKDLKSNQKTFKDKVNYIFANNNDTFFDDVIITTDIPTHAETIKTGEYTYLAINPNKIKSPKELYDVLTHETTHNKLFETSNINDDVIMHEFISYADNIFTAIKQNKKDEAYKFLNMFKQYTKEPERFGYTKEEANILESMLETYIKEPTLDNKNRIMALIKDVNDEYGKINKNMVQVINDEPKYIDTSLNEFDKKYQTKKWKEYVEKNDTDKIKQILEDKFDTTLGTLKIGKETKLNKDNSITISQKDSFSKVVEKLDKELTNRNIDKYNDSFSLIKDTNDIVRKEKITKQKANKIKNILNKIEPRKINIIKELADKDINLEKLYKTYSKYSNDDIKNAIYDFEKLLNGKLNLKDINTKDRLIKSANIIDTHIAIQKKLDKYSKKQKVNYKEEPTKSFENSIYEQLISKDIEPTSDLSKKQFDNLDESKKDLNTLKIDDLKIDKSEITNSFKRYVKLYKDNALKELNDFVEYSSRKLKVDKNKLKSGIEKATKIKEENIVKDFEKYPSTYGVFKVDKNKVKLDDIKRIEIENEFKELVKDITNYIEQNKSFDLKEFMKKINKKAKTKNTYDKTEKVVKLKKEKTNTKKPDGSVNKNDTEKNKDEKVIKLNKKDKQNKKENKIDEKAVKLKKDTKKENSETEKQIERKYEYINKEFNETYIDTKSLINRLNLEEPKEKLKLKIKESIDYERAIDNFSKYGTTDMKKYIDFAGGSDSVHLLALVHEVTHNLYKKLPEREIINISNAVLNKLLKEEPRIKQRWNIDNEFEKMIQKYNYDEKIVKKVLEEIVFNKNIRKIIFGEKTIYSTINKYNEIFSREIENIVKKITNDEKIKETIEKINEFVPKQIKHILFEANILKPDEPIEELLKLKERMKTASNIYKKISYELINSLNDKYTIKQLNLILDTGILNISKIFNVDIKKVLDDINNVKTITKEQEKLIKNSLDFRYAEYDVGSNKKIYNEITFEKFNNGVFKNYYEFLIKRAKYILDKENQIIEPTDELEHLSKIYNELSQEVLRNEYAIIDYKPYILKTFDVLHLAKSKDERLKLIKNGYTEIEPYIFIMKQAENDITSSFLFLNSLNKKTGLRAEFGSLKELNNFIKESGIKNYNVFLNNKTKKYELIVFPKKETFKKVYSEIEPTEYMKTIMSNIVDKFLNKKLIDMVSFKENLKEIISIKEKKGYVLATKEQDRLIRKIFKKELEQIAKDKNIKQDEIKIYIKKEYADMLLYESFNFNNEKINIIYKIYQSLIKRLKGNLTYKSATAFTSGIMSGITGLLYLGVNPKYIHKIITQTYKEYKEWLKYENKFKEIFVKSGWSEARKFLKQIKKNNVFAEIYYDGLLGTLEPSDTMLFGSTHDDKVLYSILKKIDNKFGTNNADTIIKMIKTGLLDKETIIGSYLVDFYSKIDLFTRASAYKYLKENVGKEKAINMINDLFIDFKRERIGWIADLENSGIPFLSFMLRMQGGIIKTAYNRPLTFFAVVALYEMISDDRNDDFAVNGLTRIDSWFLHRTFMDTLTFKLSVYNQILNGKLDKVITHTFIPREYLLIDRAFERDDYLNILGIYTNKSYFPLKE